MSQTALPVPPHRIAVLALDGVISLDLSIPCLVFGHARRSDGSPAYDVRVCGPDRRVDAGAFGVHVPHELDAVATAETVIVPGTTDLERSPPEAVLDALQAAWSGGARLTSICTGAFVLAATGLLDGRRATTHWKAASSFRQRFPAVDLDPNVLFVDEGRLVTSAGAAAGLDMCFHLLRKDLGQAAAAEAARLAVAPLDRDGGQAQFIRREPAHSASSLAPVLDWALAHLDQPMDVACLARRAGVSRRTFARRFRDQTGATPLQWLQLARIRRAQQLLEESAGSLEEIATAVGFESVVTFRSRFRREVGLPPAAYRRRFTGAGGGSRLEVDALGDA